jgi:hypothetical protein
MTVETGTALHSQTPERERPAERPHSTKPIKQSFPASDPSTDQNPDNETEKFPEACKRGD